MEDRAKLRKNYERGIFQWYHPLEFDANNYAADLLCDAEDGSFLVYDTYPLNTEDVNDEYVYPDTKFEIAYKEAGNIKKAHVVSSERGHFRLLKISTTFTRLKDLVEFFWDPDGKYKKFKKTFPFKYAIPYTNIANIPFYFGFMTRETAEAVLISNAVGSFLIRDSRLSNSEVIFSCVYTDREDLQTKSVHVQIPFKNMRKTYGAHFGGREIENFGIAFLYSDQSPYTPMIQNFHPVQRRNVEDGLILPQEILRMDEQSIQLFKKALQEGKDKCYDIRVIVLGHYGAGKTTLTKRLIGENFNIESVKSTNGVDIFVVNCTVLPDGTWKRESDEYVDEMLFKRMANALKFFDMSSAAKEIKDSDRRYHNSEKITSEGEYETFLQTRGRKMSNPSMLSDFERAEEENIHPTNASVGTKIKNKNSSQMREKDINDPTVVLDGIGRRTYVKSIEISQGREKNQYGRKSEDFSEEAEDFTLGNKDPGVVNKQQIERDLKKVIEVTGTSSMPARISLWDFAGQAIFYTTHLAFLSKRAQYLLVTDVSRSLKQLVEDDDFSSIGGKQKMAISSFICFWMNVIHAIATCKGSPKVFLAATHKDKLKYIPHIKDQLILEYFERIQRLLSGYAAKDHLYEEMFCVDCTDPSDESINLLRKRIYETAVKEEHWGEEIPSSWIFLERQLRIEKRTGQRILLVEDIKSINDRLSVKISSDEYLNLFLRFQHAIGEVLFFNEENLKDLVIIDPQWLIDSFKYIITAEEFVDRQDKELMPLWKLLYEKAILKSELIQAVWKKHEDQRFLEHKDYLLLLLTKLAVIAKPVAYDENGKEKNVDFYVIPCMLSEPPNLLAERVLDSSNVVSSALCFIFHQHFLPPAVFFRLLANCVAHFPIANFQNMNCIYTKLAFFRIGMQQAFMIEHRGNKILLRVTSNAGEPSKDMYYGIRLFISESIREIIGMFKGQEHEDGTSLSSLYSVLVLCNEKCVPYTYHEDGNVWVCRDKGISHDPDSTTLKTQWAKRMAGARPWCVQMVEGSIPDLERNCLDMKPTYQELGRLARRIGSENRELAIMLGLKVYEVDQIMMSFGQDITDANFQILRRWMAKEQPHKCTFSTLQDAMKEADSDLSALYQVQHITTTTVSKAFMEDFLQMIPSDEEIDIIALHIGIKYQQLAIELGLMPERLEQINMDKRRSLDRVKRILKEWRTNQGIDATYLFLCNAMYEVVIDVSILKKYL